MLRQGVLDAVADGQAQFPWVEVYSIRVGMSGVSVKFGGTPPDSYTLDYDLERGVALARSYGMDVTVTHHYGDEIIIPTPIR